MCIRCNLLIIIKITCYSNRFIPGMLGRDHCGDHTDASAYIKSPNYPSLYPNDLDCTYTVRQPEGVTISLKWEFFSIEWCRQCFCDYVKVTEVSIECAIVRVKSLQYQTKRYIMHIHQRIWVGVM